MNDDSPQAVLTARGALAVLTAFVTAVNAGQHLSDQARFLALDALEILSRKVA